MISTRTDITDLMLQRILTSNTFNLNQAIEQLVSGSKLNHAKDNAANFSIATSISTKLNSMYVIQDNTLLGIDMLQTAENGLNSINDCFMQLRSLSVQAANGTYGETQKMHYNWKQIQ
jgi:flagellin